jgi:branched-chain amino acid transport system ATP-binding protein
MSGPALLMLDEPSLGLAPGVAGEIFAAIRKLREGGITLLIVEQNLRMALAVADYGYVLERGEIVIEGANRGLASDPRVIVAYLGRA